MSIPKILHQVWTGPNPPPVHLMDTWRELNPDWEYKLWTEDTIPFPLETQTWYDWFHDLPEPHRWQAYHSCSNLIRYEMLLHHGGVYLDADTYCIRPLEDWLLARPVLLSYYPLRNQPGSLSATPLGCVPGHGFFRDLVDGLVAGVPAIPAWQSCANRYLALWFYSRKWQARRKQFQVLPAPYFIPVDCHSGGWKTNRKTQRYDGPIKPFAEHIGQSTSRLPSDLADVEPKGDQ